MTLISRLRNNSWILLVFIAIALVSFLLMDALQSQSGALTNNRRPEYATIAGEDVTPEEFSQRRSEALLEYLTFNNLIIPFENGQYQPDAATEFQVTENAWEQFVNEKLIERELAKLGITITDEEFTNLIYGTNPHPVIQNYYIGLSKSGQYDANLLPTWVNQISNPEQQQQNPQLRQEYYQFIAREKVARRDYLQNKYMSLFSEAVYVPEWMTKRNYTLTNRRATFSFLSLPYTLVADSTIIPTEAELKNYYNENKNRFKQTESRVIEYVGWEFTPTSADSANTLNTLMESVEKMKSSKDDSMFIATRSQDPERFGVTQFSRVQLFEMQMDSAIVDSIFNKPAGTLVGPFLNNGFYKFAKIKNRENMPDSVNSRHILIAINEQQDSTAARTKIDSLMTLLNDGADFAQLARDNSNDPGSAEKGGDLDWATPAVNFVPEFKDYLFKTGTVGVYGLVKTQFGYHIIEIKEIKNREDFVKLAFLSRQIEAGKETIDSIDRIAGSFFDTNQNPEAFNKGIGELGLQKITSPPIQKNQYELTGIPGSREIILWAFDAEKDEFKYFSLPDRIVVAYVQEVRENGIAELDNVRVQVEQEVIREKKGEELTKRIADAMGEESSLQAIASKLNVPVDTSQNASMATPTAVGVGREPKLIGAVFGIAPGNTTKPIAGSRGAFLANLIQITEPQQTEDFTLNRNQLTYSVQNRFIGQNFQGQQQPAPILNELKEKAGVEDNRYLFGN
jgi:peptidyl-prolyl cis-trans isomerase D